MEGAGLISLGRRIKTSNSCRSKGAGRVERGEGVGGGGAERREHLGGGGERWQADDGARRGQQKTGM